MLRNRTESQGVSIKKKSTTIASEKVTNVLKSPFMCWIRYTEGQSDVESLNSIYNKILTGEMFIAVLTLLLVVSTVLGYIFGPHLLYPILGILAWKSFINLKPLKIQVDALKNINRECLIQIDKQKGENERLSDSVNKLDRVKEAIEQISQENDTDFKDCLGRISIQAECLKEQVNSLKHQNEVFEKQNKTYSKLLNRYCSETNTSGYDTSRTPN